MHLETPVHHIAWITDLHMDHLEGKNPKALGRLRQYLNERQAELVILGGDISESRTLDHHLAMFSEAAERPVAFVLGNHDYYFSDVESAHRTAAAVSYRRGLTWLAGDGPLDLGGCRSLVGCGGWGDARRGDLEDFVILTDFAAIADLAACVDREDFWMNGFRKRERLVAKLQDLGAAEAGTLYRHLNAAVSESDDVMVLTHVTPFHETSTDRGRAGSDNGFPCFVWEAARQVLESTADAHPEKEFLVLSGHTHDASSSRIRPNLLSVSASADYGELRCRMITCGDEGGFAVGESETV